jgi:hypothetical protein
VKGEITPLSYNPLPLQIPRSPGTSPQGLASLKRKNHPIVVTLGGIGSSYASLHTQSLAFYPCYKLRDNSANSHNFHSSLSIPDMLFSCTEVNLYIKKNSDLSFVVILLLFLCVLLLFKFRSIIVNQLCNHT